MSSVNAVSNVVSTNGLMSADLDALQQMFNSLKQYIDALESLRDQLRLNYNNLPNYWQGNAAQHASEQLR